MNTGARQSNNPIDWSAIHIRMERAEAAMREALNPSPLRAKEIMDARAIALARTAAPVHPPGARFNAVEFRLGRERYAIETRFVREVIRFVDYTPIPKTSESIIGVTNLRGTVLAVVDLCRLFNIPRQGLTDLSRLIVLGERKNEFGVLADEMRGQIELSVADVLPDSTGVSGVNKTYLRGLTSEALIILDGVALLAGSNANK